jgi:hypothetical protein
MERPQPPAVSGTSERPETYRDRVTEYRGDVEVAEAAEDVPAGDPEGPCSLCGEQAENLSTRLAAATFTRLR